MLADFLRGIGVKLGASVSCWTVKTVVSFPGSGRRTSGGLLDGILMRMEL